MSDKLRCTRGDCMFINARYGCNILMSHCTKEPCPFFKTQEFYDKQVKEIKQRLKDLGSEL